MESFAVTVSPVDYYQHFLQTSLQQLIKTRVRICCQLPAVTIFADAAAFQDHDLVRALDRSQAVRDDDRCTVLEQLVDGAFEALFRGGIKT